MNFEEKDFELVVEKKELGLLETNAINILEKVKEVLPSYSAENYNEENIEKAKADKALLNKTSKALNDERIKIENEFMKPFENFKSIVKTTTDLIKEASSKIDEIVKEVDSKAKEEKRQLCVEIYNKNIEELSSILPFERIFNDKWLNKGTKEKEIEKEISDIKETVRSGLKAIEELQSEFELEIKNSFLQDLNITNAIFKNSQLIEAKKVLSVVEEKSEELKDTKIEEMVTEKVVNNKIDLIKTYVLEITGTVSQLTKLREFLDLNQMEYKKVGSDK